MQRHICSTVRPSCSPKIFKSVMTRSCAFYIGFGTRHGWGNSNHNRSDLPEGVRAEPVPAFRDHVRGTALRSLALPLVGYGEFFGAVSPFTRRSLPRSVVPHVVAIDILAIREW